MSTTLNNQALVSYYYNGEQSGGSAASNMISTTLLDQYGISAVKTALTPSFRPGQRVAYVISVVNNGQGPLYNVTVADNLGGAGALVYLNNSMRVYLDGALTSITPIVSGNSLITTMSGPLESGQTLLLVYVAMVSSTLESTVNSITNAAAVSANSGCVSGTLITAAPSPAATIVAESYAQLSVYKQADRSTVSVGGALTYTFTLTNTGNEAATGVVMTDALPASFVPNLVQLTVNGATTTFSEGQYSTDPSTHVLTLPTSSGPSISVPAATENGPGTATITVTGTITG